MPSVSRTFDIGNSPGPSLSITLHEPSLTGDNLGHKTWAASYLLAKRLPQLRHYIPPLSLSSPSNQSSPSSPTLRVLELGAGTGLVGITFASLFDNVVVHLTDLPEIVPNLCRNLEANAPLILAKRSRVDGYALDWANLPSSPAADRFTFDIVLAADPLYSPEHPALLVGAISWMIKKDGPAWVIVEYPVRTAYTGEVEALREGLSRIGLVLKVEGEETGYDDWEDGEKEVVCRWGVWARESRK